MNEGYQQSIVDYKARIEAILFACGEPIELSQLADVLNISISALRTQLDNFSSINDDKTRGIKLVFVENKVQLATKEKYSDDIKKVLSKSASKLTQASMETLSIIAYNQPVTRAFVEQLRGVNSNFIINSLVEKGLIEEAGRLNIPGHPVAFKTTDLFLRSFSLKSLEELPSLEEIKNGDKGDEL